MKNQFKQTAIVAKLFYEKMHRVKTAPLREKEDVCPHTKHVYISEQAPILAHKLPFLN